MEDYLIIALFGAVTAWDTTSAGQFMISQPIVSTTLAGLFLGHPETGLLIGCIMQLIWLKLVPAGGSVHLNGNLGSLTAVSLFSFCSSKGIIPQNTLLFIALLYGIITSYFFGLLTVRHRQFNLILLDKIHNMVKKGAYSGFILIHLFSVGVTALAGAFLTVAAAYIGFLAVDRLPDSIIGQLTSYAEFGLYALYSIGFGTVISMVWEKRAWYFPILGAALGIIILLLK